MPADCSWPLLRFRPILMTTMAALLGALPLMLGGGVGSELRHPLGVTIVGGLIVSQVLTLFTTPVIYLAFDRLAQRFAPKEDSQADAETRRAHEADDHEAGGFDDGGHPVHTARDERDPDATRDTDDGRRHRHAGPRPEAT